MRKSILTAAIIFGITVATQARHTEAFISSDAMKAFSEKYPDARVKNWDLDRCTDMDVAKFKDGSRKEYAFFAPDGKWIKTETKLAFTKDLPVPVRDGFGYTKFRAWHIDRINKIDAPDGRSYTIQVHKDNGPDGSIPGDDYDTYVLAFDTNGNLVNKDHLEGTHIDKR